MKKNKFRVWCKRRNGWLSDNDHSLHCSSNWMMNIFTGEIIDFVDADNQYLTDPEPTYYMKGTEIIRESPYIVQQWTGILDYDDVEIYDGDIVKICDSYSHMYGQLGVIGWSQSNACDDVVGWSIFKLYIEIVTFNRESMKSLLKTLNDIELIEECDMEGRAYIVVGNIFENSNLLK